MLVKSNVTAVLGPVLGSGHHGLKNGYSVHNYFFKPRKL